MTLFVAVCAILVVIALLFALPPFLRAPKATPDTDRAQANVDIYREQLRDLERDFAAGALAREQYERDRQELSRRMLEDVQTGTSAPIAASGSTTRILPAILIAALFPIVAVLLYMQIGAPSALDPQTLKAAAPHKGQQFTREEIEQMVALLAERMKKEPDNLEGWTLLGRSYAAMGRYADAAAALRHAIRLKANDPDLLADYADTLAMASGEKLDGEPLKLIDQALAIDPDHQKSLALAGTGAFERGDFAGAVTYWERLLKTLPPESEGARAIQASIDEARQQAGGKVPEAAEAARGAPTGTAGRIAGVVTLAPTLAGKAAPDDTLFVYARALQGPPMPLAVQRFKARDLPASFSLDDSMAMAPEMKLSKHQNVMVLARISKSGNAMPQSGDLQGTTGPVPVGGSAVNIVIDRVVP